MSLRVAFDLDGTVADMFTVLRKEAETLFGDDVVTKHAAAPAAEPQSPDGQDEAAAMTDLHFTARQQALLWDRVRQIENFWTLLPEMEPGIIARIAGTAAARRWDVIFLTTRPPSAGETTQVQSQRWLHAHGFPFPSVFVVQGSRGKVASALGLDVVVDDRPENCLDVAVESKARALLVWHGDPAAVPPGAARLGVKVASSISQAVALIERYDDLRQDTGMAKSFRRLFSRAQKA